MREVSPLAMSCTDCEVFLSDFCDMTLTQAPPTVFENYSMKIFLGAGWSEEDVHKLVEEVKKDVHDPGLQGYSCA